MATNPPMVLTKRYLGAAIGAILVIVIGGVIISRQFPGLTHGPLSSAEMIEAVFKAPLQMPTDALRFAMDRVQKEAVIGFVQLTGAPADVKQRVVQFVQDERFAEQYAPFVYYLHDLYGVSALAESDAAAELDYGSAPKDVRPDESEGSMLHHAAVARRHAGNALRLFDALFLQVKPGATDALPVPDRYDPASYEDIKTVVRSLAAELIGPPGDAKGQQQSEYVTMLEETLRDDEKLSDFVEFFADLIRQLAAGWLESFVTREKRKEARLDWIAQMERQNRYFEIADYARRRNERKLVIHLAVDGLQGKLLEGLAQLSSGDRSGASARYVIDLVKRHETGLMDPANYSPRQPPPLGETVRQLAGGAPNRPDYLENFKKYFFSPDAPAIVVHVATVDTPSISVRNLPIIFSGHGVAGRHGTGIPNFSYLDRSSGRGWYFWGSDILHMRDIFANREHLVPHSKPREGTGARTLMQRLWQFNSVSAMATIDTGAVEKISSEVGMAIGELERDTIEKIIILNFRKRAEIERQLNSRRKWLAEHRNTSNSLVASLITKPITLKTFHQHARFVAEHEDDGLPDYLLWYNPWPDHFAHGKGPYSDAILGLDGEYDRLDFFLGKMLEIYLSVPGGSSGATCLDQTMIGVVSDHGLVYTPKLVSTDEMLFGAMRSGGIQITHLKLTHDEGGLPAIHGRNRVKPTRPYDAVVGSTAGGSYIIDLFHSDETASDESWKHHPDYHDLRKLRLLSGQTIDFIEVLRTQLKDSMDFALIREYRPGPGGESWPRLAGGGTIESVVRVVTPSRGDARIYRVTGPGQPTRYRYEILGQLDPFDLVGSVRDYLIPPGGPTLEQVRAELNQVIQSEGADDPTWQRLLSYTLRPDGVYQWSHLYDSDRAGTVNVFPVEHVGMNSSVPGRHAGEAFGEKNGTQLYRAIPLNRSTIQTARNGSLPVTLFHWLVGDDRFAGAAAEFGYPSLLDARPFQPIRSKNH